MRTNPSPPNLRYYDQLRDAPDCARKTIQAGRLKGMTDINPVWRIKAMTETFGPCGIGWKYEITKQWQEQYGQEVKAFTNINLYIKVDGAWSDPIPGTGGATLVEINSKGYSYVNDEGYKMSLTDALSVAMKSLGVAADVYFAHDATKYVTDAQQATAPATPVPPADDAAVDAVIDDLYTSANDRASFEDAMRRHREYLTSPKVAAACKKLAEKYPKT